MLKFTRMKQGVLTDFVTIYCDHRDECSNKRCTYGTTRGLKATKEDTAFVEHRKCTQFRGSDELGTLREAEIKEVGIWKPNA